MVDSLPEHVQQIYEKVHASAIDQGNHIAPEIVIKIRNEF